MVQQIKSKRCFGFLKNSKNIFDIVCSGPSANISIGTCQKMWGEKENPKLSPIFENDDKSTKKVICYHTEWFVLLTMKL